MTRAQDDSVTLTPEEWDRILSLFEDDRSWSEAEVLEAICDGGWMDTQE